MVLFHFFFEFTLPNPIISKRFLKGLSFLDLLALFPGKLKTSREFLGIDLLYDDTTSLTFFYCHQLTTNNY